MKSNLHSLAPQHTAAELARGDNDFKLSFSQLILGSGIRNCLLKSESLCLHSVKLQFGAGSQYSALESGQRAARTRRKPLK